MEVAEDDILFADLSKRISLLIMDDDEDDPISHLNPPVSFQAAFVHPMPIMNRSVAAAAALIREQNYRRGEIKGTGVFIPQSTNPRGRKNNKQGRRFVNTSSSSTTNKFHHSHRHADNEPSYSTYTRSNNSYDHKRC